MQQGSCYVVDVCGFWRIPWICRLGFLHGLWPDNYEHRTEFANFACNFRHMDSEWQEKNHCLAVRWPEPALPWTHSLNIDESEAWLLRSVKYQSEKNLYKITVTYFRLNWDVNAVIDHSKCRRGKIWDDGQIILVYNQKSTINISQQ